MLACLARGIDALPLASEAPSKESKFKCRREIEKAKHLPAAAYSSEIELDETTGLCLQLGSSYIMRNTATRCSICFATAILPQ